jgi:hypothetical protein
MPRTNAAGELIKSVVSLTLYRKHTTPLETTVSEAVLGDGTETTLDVASAASFVAADPVFIIGDGGLDIVKIGTPAATMPISPPPKLAQTTGARFVRALAVSMGKIGQGSITWTGSRSLTAVFEEVGDAPVVYLPGTTEFGLSWSLLCNNALNVLRLMGYEEAETGDGAAEATAYQSVAGAVGQALHTELVLGLHLLRHDAKNLRIFFLNSYIEAAISSNPSRTSPALLNGAAKCSAIKIQQWT